MAGTDHHRQRLAPLLTGRMQVVQPAMSLRSAEAIDRSKRSGSSVGRRGGHRADGGRIEPDLVHEQLLDRHPEHEVLQRDRDVQREQPSAQRGYGCASA
jgi:hypothetical protein